MNRTALHVAKILWGVVCVAVLVRTYYRLDPNSDLGDVVWLQMMVIMALLSFPIGLLASLGAGAVLFVVFTISDKVFGFSPGTYAMPAVGYWSVIFFLWVVPFAAGYFQWFWLLPRWDRKRRAQSDLAERA